MAPERVHEAERLSAAAADLGVTLGPAQVAKLLGFRDLLLHWNRAFNLVSRHDEPRLLARHVLDSLSVATDIVGAEVLDLGTGAGLPGVPLAIALEQRRFTLVDRNARRIRFVARTARELGLGNVRTACADIRSMPAPARYTTVVCRAVAELDGVWELARQRLTADGRLVVLHRGQGGADAVGALPAGARLEAQRSVRIPGLPQAHQVVVLTADDAADRVEGESMRGKS